MAYQIEDIVDAVNATDRDRGRGPRTLLAMDLQKYYALPQLMKTKRVTYGDGTGFEWTLQTSLGNNARFCGLYDANSTAVPNVTVRAYESWRHATTSAAWDEHEFTMNMGESRIFDLIKMRIETSELELAKILEAAFWSKPTDSTDNTTPLGITYWIVKNNSTGFNGGNPSGFTSGAGHVSSSTYTAWANYTAQYTNVTKADLIRKLRAAMYKTDFESPVSVDQYVKGHDYGMYTTYSVVATMEEILESQNQNLGNDVASKDGMVVIRRMPMVPVPQLDADTTNPVYGINWDSLKVAVMEGWSGKVRTMQSPTQRNVVQRHKDLTVNTVCYDRRQNFVVATNT